MHMFQAQIDFYGTEVNVTDTLLLSVFTLVHRGQHVVRSIVDSTARYEPVPAAAREVAARSHSCGEPLEAAQ